MLKNEMWILQYSSVWIYEKFRSTLVIHTELFSEVEGRKPIPNLRGGDPEENI